MKSRAYGEHGPEAAASAQATLRLGLSTILKLLAPFLPFVTEEVWSWWQDGTIHRAAWPSAAELTEKAGTAGESVLAAAAACIAAIRKAKSEARVAMKHPVAHLLVSGPPSELAAIDAASSDIGAAGHVAKIELRAADGSLGFEVQIEAV